MTLPKREPSYIRSKSRTYARRKNRVEAKSELFTPQYLEGSHGDLGFLQSLARAVRKWARNALDLQAASILRDLAPELKSTQGTVLDVGCGSQPYRHLLPSNANYVGIDHSIGRSLFGYHHPDTVFFDGDRWPVLAGSVDTVLCTEVLEHVYDVPQFLSEAIRTLKPGGQLMMTVPFSARCHYIPADYWRFTPSSFDRLLREAGFSEIQVYARGNPLTVLCYKAITLLFQFAFGNRVRTVSKPLTYFLVASILPLAAVLAAIAQATLGLDFGDDCIGYTVFAVKPTVDPNDGERLAG